MALYETTFIIRQDLSQQDAEKICNSFEKVLDDAGGKLVKREYWGLRNLAYQINKNKKGHYFMFGIDAGTDAISNLERRIELNENILRKLTIKVDEIEQDDSAIIKDEKSN